MNKKITSTDSPATLAHKLWDEIFKSIISHMPEQLIPLFKHVFQKDYPRDVPIELLSAEYPAPMKSNPKELSSIFADIVLQIAGSDIYHMECQMEKDDAISIRMMEYDTHIAILYGLSDFPKKAQPTLYFPHSVILFLGNNNTVPDRRSCHIIFPDGTETDYSIPVIKVQDYSLKKIRKKHLTLFLPFTLLRFRPKLNAKRKKMKTEELTIFVNKIIIVLNNELSNGYITQRQYKDYINYIRMAADQIFFHHPEIHKGVSDMLTTIIPSYSEMEDQITARVTARVTAEITAEITDEVTAKVTDEVTAKVTDEVTAKVTDEVTAKVTDEVSAKFQDKLQAEKAKWVLELQKRDSENNRLRALLKAHGINENEV